jgi:hypothetical protein
MSTETEYTNCISLEQMEYLDLFDKLPYKVVKKIVKMDDDTEFEVEIKDLPHDDYNKRFTSFKFTLEIDISQGSLPLMVEKHYCVIKEYVGSSPMAMFIDENLTIEVEEEEEEDIVFHCESCKKAIVRDSEDHDFSKCDMEDKWYCVDCPCEEEEEEEEVEEYAVILTDENGEVLKKSNDEDESSEEEEEEEDEEKEYTIEIPVVGLGYCRYYDKEDRDKYVVYCKNAVWKMKGDKTARDMEGNYCETESEEESSEEEEEEHECELCKKHVQETEYLPSKEDEEKQQILGNDYCLECYKKVEKFEFVENIDLDK